MTDPGSPLKRPLSASNLIRGLIALVAVLAIGSAFLEGHIGMAIAGLAFVIIAAALGYRTWRARQAP
ncbi:MAG TPA: hypothetical protein VFI39_07520 [Gemmatimonadales bacterium]|nr:hypothetical protein [Gemmatimonadales bacterium]